MVIRSYGGLALPHPAAPPARHRSQPAEPAPPEVGIPTLLSHQGRNSDFAILPEKPITGPAPKVRQRPASRQAADRVFFSPLLALPSILRWQQDCPTQCAAPSILRWQQDCPTQSCAGNRLAPLNPASAGRRSANPYDRHGVKFLASELETGTNHFLVAARVEFRVEFRRRLHELRSDCSDSCRLRRAKARKQNIAPLSLEGVFQMDSILPERLLALAGLAFWLASGWLSGWVSGVGFWLVLVGFLVLACSSPLRALRLCGCVLACSSPARWLHACSLPNRLSRGSSSNVSGKVRQSAASQLRSEAR